MTNTIKGLLVVVHPDDCVIFGWPIIKKYNGIQCKILYMTYNAEEPRGKEIKEFWNAHGISVDFCGVVDNHVDLDGGTIVSFDKGEVKEKLLKLAGGYDILVTHGEDGEYGHPHHVFVHQIIRMIDTPQIYFSDGHDANLLIDANGMGEQDLSKLPLHREVIEGFIHRYNGSYHCDSQAKGILQLQ